MRVGVCNPDPNIHIKVKLRNERKVGITNADLLKDLMFIFLYPNYHTIFR
jgi:hypothetical protein